MRKMIKTYPFTGLDCEQIKEVADNVNIVLNGDDFDLNYSFKYYDSSNNLKSNSVSILNEDLKYTLSYFYFLNSMRRVFFNEKVLNGNYDVIPDANTYIDITLMVINEYSSLYRENNQSISYDEILRSFGKQYKDDDLNRLYDNEDDYLYLNKLFGFLIKDSYSICNSKYREDGIHYNKISDGYLENVVNYIVNNKDDSFDMDICFRKNNGPVLSKNSFKSKVI